MNPTTKQLVDQKPSAPTLGTATLILAGRIIGGWRGQPAAVAITWAFPVLVSLIFLGLFGGALTMPGGTSYADFLIPGMLAVTMLFGLETTTLAAAADASRGIKDRFRSLPINAAAIVLGRCLADLFSSLIGMTIMIGFGLAIGWRPETTPWAALTALGVLLLLRVALLWIGISIGYRASSVESVAYVQILVWPVAMVSSVFVDPATMPGWLALLAELNPISATATTVRDLMGAATWPDHQIAGWLSNTLAVAWPAVLVAVFMPVAARSFRTGG